mmetsp:Transcript_52584/g.167189  ORF Transcript_52584/g.167189 Transcript_52584/m.167189 type:complete len:258 (+) Transcript_52584:173-946(+)
MSSCIPLAATASSTSSMYPTGMMPAATCFSASSMRPTCRTREIHLATLTSSASHVSLCITSLVKVAAPSDSSAASSSPPRNSSYLARHAMWSLAIMCTTRLRSCATTASGRSRSPSLPFPLRAAAMSLRVTGALCLVSRLVNSTSIPRIARCSRSRACRSPACTARYSCRSSIKPTASCNLSMASTYEPRSPCRPPRILRSTLRTVRSWSRTSLRPCIDRSMLSWAVLSPCVVCWMGRRVSSRSVSRSSKESMMTQS